MTVRTCLALLCAVAVTACATTGDEVDAAPDYSPIEALPVTDNGRLVIACLEQSLSRAAAGAHQCEINLNLGGFINESTPRYVVAAGPGAGPETPARLHRRHGRPCHT